MSQLAEIQDFRPLFTYWITTTQVLMMMMMIIVMMIIMIMTTGSPLPRC